MNPGNKKVYFLSQIELTGQQNINGDTLPLGQFSVPLRSALNERPPDVQRLRSEKYIFGQLHSTEFRQDTGPYKPTVGAPPALNESYKDEFSAAARATKHKRVGVRVLYPEEYVGSVSENV